MLPPMFFKRKSSLFEDKASFLKKLQVSKEKSRLFLSAKNLPLKEKAFFAQRSALKGKAFFSRKKLVLKRKGLLFEGTACLFERKLVV